MQLTVIVRGKLYSYEVSNIKDIDECNRNIAIYHSVTPVSSVNNGHYLSDNAKDCIVGHWVITKN